MQPTQEPARLINSVIQMNNMQKNKWFWIRIIIVIMGSSSGLSITSLEILESSNVDWIACLALLLFIPFGLSFVIAIQAFNPLSAKIWRKPSWYLNPFIFKEPLQGFHLIAFHFMFAGIVACMTLVNRGKEAAPLALSLLSIGIGIWLGVQLSMLLFKKKMEII